MENVGGVKKGSGHLEHVNELVLIPCTIQKKYQYKTDCSKPTDFEKSRYFEKAYANSTLSYNKLQIKLPFNVEENYTQILNIENNFANTILFTNLSAKHSIFDSPYFDKVTEKVLHSNARFIQLHDYLHIDFQYTSKHMEHLSNFFNNMKHDQLEFLRKTAPLEMV